MVSPQSSGFLEAIPSPEPIINLFIARAEAAGDRIATYSKVEDRWVGTTWRESRASTEECAYGLLELGVERGTPVAILSNTRREWAMMDMANIAIGGITVGIYPTLTGPQARQLLELSGARIVFVDDRAQRVKLEEACVDLDGPITIITMEPRAEGDRTITLDELRRRGAKRRKEHPDEFSRRAREARTDDIVSYIYTSGTTGEPKGAVLTHANFHYVIHATNAVVPYEGQRGLIFLPLAHSLQRYASYLGLIVDVEGYYCDQIDKFRDYLLEVRPTAFAAVPRVLEKIHSRAMANVEQAPPFKRAIFDRSMEVLNEVGRLRRDGRVPGVRQRIYARTADRLVGSKVRDRLGGRVRFIACGGAPLSRDIHEFFEDIGIPILVGYGLTETSAPACLNTLTHRRVSTVGRPLPGTEIKIASDGEILIRGPGVFRGYFRNEPATKAALTSDGWFKTGDVGEMSRDGFLSITDRKKDLIITANGKNVAPQPLENELKRHPFIAQAVVIGDNRPYLTALVAFDPDVRKQLCERHRVAEDSEQLASVPEVKSALDLHLAELNKSHAPFEQIKKVALLPREMTIEAGELTPTLKVKRRVVNEHFGDRIEGLYKND